MKERLQMWGKLDECDRKRGRKKEKREERGTWRRKESSNKRQSLMTNF